MYQLASLLQAKLHFFAKVQKTKSCWLWTGGVLKKRHGYGNFICRPYVIRLRAHRASYSIHYKKQLREDEHVLHKCDNPLCVRPSHLFLGDQKLNVKDMVAKNRQAKGSKHSKAKLIESDVIAIRRDKRKQKDIAADFGVSIMAISDIQRHKTWTHV